MVKVIVVEDDIKAINAIVDTLSLFCNGFEITGIANNIRYGLELIKEKSPDLVLYNIDLPDETVGLMHKIDFNSFRSIFITANFCYAERAGKLGILDYLLKPIDPCKLVSMAYKVWESKEKKNEARQEAQKPVVKTEQGVHEKLVLRTLESIYPVSIKDIQRCESGGAYTFFYLNGGKKITVSKALKEYEYLLSAYGFCRVHQSHLININHVDRYDKRQGGMIVMNDGVSVPVSFRRKEGLLELFKRFYVEK